MRLNGWYNQSAAVNTHGRRAATASDFKSNIRISTVPVHSTLGLNGDIATEDGMSAEKKTFLLSIIVRYLYAFRLKLLLFFI